MKTTPILVYSDSPNLPGGLSRICRDVATNLTKMAPLVRVATLGRGGDYSRRLPFAQYNFPEQDQWGEHHIERAWRDFAGDEKGIVFTIWDASRLHWFSRPHPEMGRLYEFLEKVQFKRWGYFPVDGANPRGEVSSIGADTLQGYDRVLAYVPYGQEILQKSRQDEVDWLPHGINLNTFQPRDRYAARMKLQFDKEDIIVGCVMTNQFRKDWGKVFEILSELVKVNPRFRLWAHIDTLERHWSIPALVSDWGLDDKVAVTTTASDLDMSYMYSCCDVTILPSLGEGFGYPIVESLACNVPVVHVNHAGGADLVVDELKDSMLVPVNGGSYQGLHNIWRPNTEVRDWVDRIVGWTSRTGDPEEWGLRDSIAHLEWRKLWPVWRKWFERGLES